LVFDKDSEINLINKYLLMKKSKAAKQSGFAFKSLEINKNHFELIATFT
jgi:hypothetical protein